MIKPTKEEMDKFIKYHQRGLFMARKMLEIDRDELDAQLILGDAISALIESSDKGMEVDEMKLRQFLYGLEIAVWEQDLQLEKLKAIFREAGVKFKEEKP